ncbi:hypothetical protein A2153_02940 [Candidatus Gottesmanbacteria bacterium RBG_16_38_7b]|uniref:Uncharacterized protein n=1 Tax=Candidatus Gottesmanbacteria bacterium RBG_16_38_7b TaxID=1798372 RepID=A0A1F5YJE9_9BACT|nr:MAG: hypothetical protein A2153_02940 [Candidatus Gottesmanbacteria bacterium RBG_16_38_7b]
MSNGTSFIGFPIAIFPTMTITSLIRISLIFPLLIFLNFQFYKIFLHRLHLSKVNFFTKLTLSLIFILFAFWYKPVTKTIEEATAPSKNEIAEKTSNLSNWKKYENDKLGFSFSYPGYLKVEERNNSGDEYVFLIPPGEENPLFNVEVPQNFHPLQAYEYNLTVTHDLIEEKDVTVDGIKGKMIVSGYLLAKDKTRTYSSVAIISNDETYEFSGISFDLDNPDNAIFDKILSTIKFNHKGLNKFEELPVTAAWTIFTNPDSLFSVRHPEEWNVENIKPIVPSQMGRLSYSTFKDQDFIYDLSVEVLLLSKLSNLYENNDVEKCSDYQQNILIIKSGKQINYSKCEYANHYLLQFPEKDRLFVVRSKKGIINPPIVDAFLSSITPE